MGGVSFMCGATNELMLPAAMNTTTTCEREGESNAREER